MGDYTMQLPIRARNPISFPEGSIIRSVYSTNVYEIVKHFSNGMCTLKSRGTYEKWNSCNNPHFIPADYISLSVRSLCLL